MENFNFLTVLLILSCFHCLISYQGCGKFCVCTLEQTDCYFTMEKGVCLGEVSVLETYILNIYGPVCPKVRRKLHNEMFHNTVKIFNNDVCTGIPNCRYFS